MNIQRAGRGKVVASRLLTGASKFIQTAPLPINDPCLILMFLLNIVNPYSWQCWALLDSDEDLLNVRWSDGLIDRIQVLFIRPQ
jgi:hypothetical protein